jgi:hypothetical protein
MTLIDVVFCCVGALAILNQLHLVDKEALSWWLAERQLPCGGLNGRPEKKEDVGVTFFFKLKVTDRQVKGGFTHPKSLLRSATRGGCSRLWPCSTAQTTFRRTSSQSLF